MDKIINEVYDTSGALIETEEVALSPKQIKEMAKAALSSSDKDMARVAEDIINLLVSKGVISEADIPKSVKDKLENRTQLRNKLKGQ